MAKTPEQFKQYIEAQVLPLAQKLGTRQGFFEYWFKILPRCKSQKSAFDIVNLLHLKIFKEEKYNSFTSFYKQKNSYLKNLRK